MSDRVNWRFAGMFLVLGLGLVGAGLALDEFSRDAWSSLFIDIGVAIALVAVLVKIEQTVVRSIAKETATAVSERSARALRERVERLETLEEAQTEQRSRRRSTSDQLVEDLLSGELTPTSVGQVVVEAQKDQLFDGEYFRIRTSEHPAAHVLYMLPLVAANGVQILWLDFEAFELGDPLSTSTGSIPAPARNESTVMWTAGNSADQIASELEVGLERKNLPYNDFNFKFTLERLATSFRIMREARGSSGVSDKRLEGRLRLLINNEWAITSFGLESTSRSIAMRAKWAGFHGGNSSGMGVAIWEGTQFALPNVFPERDACWEDAIAWVKERERWSIVGSESA
jgi:hypothetical protein